MTQVPDAPYIREAETKGYWPNWQNNGGKRPDEVFASYDGEAEDDYNI